jgi:ketosteroid isomerase-like protein
LEARSGDNIAYVRITVSLHRVVSVEDKMRGKKLLFASLVVAAAVSPALSEDLSKTFADLNRKFEVAVNGHNPKEWASLFGKDGTLVPAGTPIVQGLNNIEKWAEGATKVWNKLSITNGPSTVNGSVAWQVGTWEGNINTPDRKTMDLAGNFLVVLQKEGSEWKIIAATWNTNPPKM